MPHQSIQKLREESSKVHKEVQERTIGYLTAALGLVAGLAWNDAVKALIEYIFPLAQGTIVAKFLYAAVATAIVAIITMYLARLIIQEENNKT